jgi:hypothetical protein
MEFDNVEAIKNVVAIGLGASIVPSLTLGAKHVAANACAATQSEREPTGRIGAIARKAGHRWHGARLRGTVSLAALALILRYCTGSTIRRFASMPSVPRFLMNGV